jgi:hypothetical protein
MNIDNTTTDLASAIVGELIERGLVPNCTDTDNPRELEFQDAIKDAINIHPLSLMIWEASRGNPVLPSVFDQALRIGLKVLMDGRDEALERMLKSQKETGRIHIVQPELQHRLVGEAKEMFDDLYKD